MEVIKFKNEPQYKENSLYFTISLRQRRHILKACEKICIVGDESAVSKSAAYKWFTRFHFGIVDVKDEPCSGESMTDKSDEILKKIEQGLHINGDGILNELYCYHQTLLNHSQKNGYKKRLYVWTAHDLSEKPDGQT